MSDDMTIRAGTLLCFSSGAYSDYGYKGHFVALEDITRERMHELGKIAKAKEADIEAAQDAWTRESGEEYPTSAGAQEGFIAEMIRAGLLVSITVTEIHIGSYGELELP
jgi:uncharacterized damage-inducible protein DinB